MEFIAELPAHFDMRTSSFRMFDGALCVVHPDHPPLMVELDGTIHPVIALTTDAAVTIFD